MLQEQNDRTKAHVLSRQQIREIPWSNPDQLTKEWGKNGTWRDFSLRTSVFPCQFYSINTTNAKNSH